MGQCCLGSDLLLLTWGKMFFQVTPNWNGSENRSGRTTIAIGIHDRTFSFYQVNVSVELFTNIWAISNVLQTGRKTDLVLYYQEWTDHSYNHRGILSQCSLVSELCSHFLKIEKPKSRSSRTMLKKNICSVTPKMWWKAPATREFTHGLAQMYPNHFESDSQKHNGNL